MLRIRVSTIDSFRLACETEWKDAGELCDYIRAGQTSEPSWQMAAGTAWHAALEGQTAENVTPERVAYGGYWFDRTAVRRAQEHRGAGVMEMTNYGTMCGVQIKGTCDHARGLELRDAKTKFSTPDVTFYESALQWRFYLWLFACERFTYDLFHMKDPDAAGYCELRSIQSVTFYRYPTMIDDLTAWVRRFLDWAGPLDLLKYLEVKE